MRGRGDPNWGGFEIASQGDRQNIENSSARPSKFMQQKPRNVVERKK